MRKMVVLAILGVLFTGIASAQTANETRQALQQAQDNIQLMEKENIPTERVENLLETANNSYLAQKNFEQEGGTADYSRAVELANQISEIQERAIRSSDRITALKDRLNELEDTSVNLTQARNEMASAEEDFQSQRFEEAEQHVEEGYSAISNAQSAQTQIESFAAAQQEDITARIKALVDYIRANPVKVGLTSLISLITAIFIFKEGKTYQLIKKRRKKRIKEDVLQKLITDIQKDYYMRKEGSPIQFNTKMERFEDMQREVVEDIEFIDDKLESRRSLLFDPEDQIEGKTDIETEVTQGQEPSVNMKDTEKSEKKTREKEQNKEDTAPVKVKDTKEESNEKEDKQDKKKEDTEAGEGVVCSDCGERFETERGLSIHRERMHGADILVNGVVCPECGDIFDTERGMHIHLGQVHKD